MIVVCSSTGKHFPKLLRARTPRDLDGPDKLLQKVLDLAKYFGVGFFMEDAHSGLLKTRDVVQGIPMRVIDYSCCADDCWPPRYPKKLLSGQILNGYLRDPSVFKHLPLLQRW